MRFAQIAAWGTAPAYIESGVSDSQDTGEDNVLVKVCATAIHPLVRARASGNHYSAKALPHIPGTDGVGTLSNGEDVYFFAYDDMSGTFADIVDIPKVNFAPIPAGADPIHIAALVNPAMSSWMALKRRVIPQPKGFSVLILGATSLAGTLAIHIARQLGAGKIIGCARNLEKLQTLDLDQIICLRDPVAETDFSSLEHVDIILDYVYGEATALLLRSLSHSPRLTQYVQIGALAAKTMDFAAASLRSQNLMMIGAGIDSWNLDELREELPVLLQTTAALPPQMTKTYPLKEIDHILDSKTVERIVLIP